ncbi:hypothetical protein B0H14DRAFT_2599893 [Mycena olivaceomarginata]|nr:hypothetical protein B0H14DRAFT_2634973 [Mycena olivaceomarginata]KAJ7820601.1 hypothetical protein B0H14DRAFT_2599893 [Mycena olivaceomarginata]
MDCATILGIVTDTQRAEYLARTFVYWSRSEWYSRWFAGRREVLNSLSSSSTVGDLGSVTSSKAQPSWDPTNSTRGNPYNILELPCFSSQLQILAHERRFIKETNKGFRGGKDKEVDAKKGTGTSKAGSSKKADEEWAKVGTLQMIIAGLDADLYFHSRGCKDLEDMYERGLAVCKSPEGGDLEFSRRWTYDEVDSWVRRMMKPKVGFGPFDLLDTRDGVPRANGSLIEEAYMNQ